MSNRILPKETIARQTAKKWVYASMVHRAINNSEDRSAALDELDLDFYARNPLGYARPLPTSPEAHKMTENLLNKMRQG